MSVDRARVRVGLVRCPGYEPAEVSAAVKRAVDLVGGITSFIRPGSTVLLKPNLLSPRPPEDAVVTHPEVVRAVARLAKGAGARVQVGDSPGGYGDNIDEVLEKSGLLRVAEEEGIEVVRFTSSRNVDGLPVSRHVLDADFVISIPKFKTHGITTLTAGVKNMFGTLTGMFKAGCHLRTPREEEFAPTLAKIYAITRPCLTVLDAVLAMEGDGPSAGRPRKTDFIMASRDAVAIDTLLAKVVGISPLDLATLRACREQGLGETDPERIEVAGEELGPFVMSDFTLPQTKLLKVMPSAVLKGAASFVRFKPVIDAAVCRRCNLCKLSCPANAITIGQRKCAIDYRACIRCLCCHEVCPYGAIMIKRNVLAKMLWG